MLRDSLEVLLEGGVGQMQHRKVAQPHGFRAKKRDRAAHQLVDGLDRRTLGADTLQAAETQPNDCLVI